MRNLYISIIVVGLLISILFAGCISSNRNNGQQVSPSLGNVSQEQPKIISNISDDVISDNISSTADNLDVDTSLFE